MRARFFFKARILVSALICATTAAAPLHAEDDTAEKIQQGSRIYSQNCSACHGPRMLDPQGAFDLKTFPRDQRERFLVSVAKGKNQMPPWGGLLSTADIEALWLYVMAGER